MPQLTTNSIVHLIYCFIANYATWRRRADEADEKSGRSGQGGKTAWTAWGGGGGGGPLGVGLRGEVARRAGLEGRGGPAVWGQSRSVRTISSALNPWIAMRFCRLPAPDNNSMDARGTAKCLAKKRISSLFAAPSTGGALILIFTASP